MSVLGRLIRHRVEHDRRAGLGDRVQEPLVIDFFELRKRLCFGGSVHIHSAALLSVGHVAMNPLLS